MLIALAWPSHVHHNQAHQWFARKGSRGWASCPMSQAGFVRISSNPKFIDGAVSPLDAISLLKKVAETTRHKFWPDKMDLSSQTHSVFGRVLAHRQVTDAYLLSLAILNGGALATLDPGIQTLLPNPTERNKYLEVIAAE